MVKMVSHRPSKRSQSGVTLLLCMICDNTFALFQSAHTIAHPTLLHIPLLSRIHSGVTFTSIMKNCPSQKRSFQSGVIFLGRPPKRFGCGCLRGLGKGQAAAAPASPIGAGFGASHIGSGFRAGGRKGRTVSPSLGDTGPASVAHWRTAKSAAGRHTMIPSSGTRRALVRWLSSTRLPPAALPSC